MIKPPHTWCQKWCECRAEEESFSFDLVTNGYQGHYQKRSDCTHEPHVDPESGMHTKFCGILESLKIEKISVINHLPALFTKPR